MRNLPPQVDSKAIIPADRFPDDSRLTIGHLAHELNSLLDGSMRCLRLVETSLSNFGSGTQADDPLPKLAAARGGMMQMAKLLQRAMRNRSPAINLFSENQTLETQVEHIRKFIEPLASEHRVAISVDLTPKARNIPTAMLGPVIMNGLRNAIQACAASLSPHRHVELSIAISPRNELLIIILDNGIGLTPDPARDRLPGLDGHGFGLDLCRQILRELDGQLRLFSVPDGGGTIFQVTAPLRSLINHG